MDTQQILTALVVAIAIIIVWLLQGRIVLYKKMVMPKGVEWEFKPSDLFKVSLAHTKLLSKRFSSSFVIHIYLPDVRRKVAQELRSEFNKQETEEHIFDTNLTVGRIVKVKLFSPEIDFSEPATKKLEERLNTIHFLGKPKDDCVTGVQQATLVISDAKTGHEYKSANFPVHVVDFAFDHISRPLLSKLVSVVLGIGSLSIFLLTLFGKIDSALGLASGTTAGALASAVYIRFLSLYQHRNTTTSTN